MKSIGIIGRGVVGSAIAECLGKKFEIVSFDIKKNSSHASIADLAGEVDGPIFICVPTPQAADGSCDTSIVESVVAEIAEAGAGPKVIIIKSTVPPRTTDRLIERHRGQNIAFNPEFLTERNSVEDFRRQTFTVVGASNAVSGMVTGFYKEALPRCGVLPVRPIQAELMKYTVNCFLALKVEFANEMADLCEALGVNWASVIGAAMLDERMGVTHWQVPGPDGKRGFGGSCFPKDTAALLAVARRLGVELPALEAGCRKNEGRR